MARQIANLVITVSANTHGATNAFTQLNATVRATGSAFSGLQHEFKAFDVAVGNLISGAIWRLGSALANLAGKIFVDAVTNAKNLNNSMIGLAGVANAYGISAKDAMDASRKLAADGLLPLRDAMAGLKNLIATGFDLKQSTELMYAFKDSAAFTRQEMYSYGDAIRTATEGLRNSRSVQVDNVGVTKNLSQIMKEHGFQLQDIADKTKGAAARQALHVGILRETVAQAGDAAKAMQTYSGAMDGLAAAYKVASAEAGNAIVLNKGVKLAIDFVADAFRRLSVFLVDNQRATLFVSDALVVLVKSLAYVLNGVAYLHRALLDLDNMWQTFLHNWASGWQQIITSWPTEFFEKRLSKGGKTLVAGMFPEELATLYKIKGALVGVMDEADKRMAENARSVVAWDKALFGASNRLTELADNIHNLRGQTIALGGDDKPVKRINELGDAADKAAKKMQALIDKLRPDYKLGLQTTGGLIEMPIVLPQIIQNLLAMQAIMDKLPTHKLGMPTGGGLIVLPKPVPPKFDFVKDAFRTLGAELSQIVGDAFKAGTFLEGIAGVAGHAGALFSESFGKALKQSKDLGIPLTKGEKALGMAGMGLEAFAGGFNIGRSGGMVKGALGGAATGALSGAMIGSVIPGIGTAVGAGVGAVVGFAGGVIGGAQKKKEEKRLLRENKAALEKQYGGMAKLNQLAEKLGVNIKDAFDAKKGEDFDKAVTKLNDAIAAQKKRMEDLGTAVAGVNKRAEVFGAQFKAAAEAGDKLKLAEIAQRAQPEFERLGLMVKGTFAGLVKETGSAIDAIRQMEPAFKVLDDATKAWGLTNTAVTEELLTNYRLITDEGLKPMFDAIEASGQVLKGLFEAKALTPDVFQALATDIGSSIQGIVDKGGDMQRTLALSAPVLQTLWEAQQRYGTITDETTVALLDQAVAQGIVGEHMKGVNERILDVLIAIGDVLGATIPDRLRGLVAPAEEAAAGIENAFANIDIPPVHVQTIWEGPGEGNVELNVPAMARGGIVRRPTLALVGERGPEAVVPLSGGSLGASSTYITDVYLDGRKIARSTAKKLPGVLRGMGV